MNWSDNVPEDEVQRDSRMETGGAEQDSTDALYQADSGKLSLDVRRVLVQLLAGPSLDGQRHSNLWPILIRDEAAIRSRLSELFLQLVIDRDLQVGLSPLNAVVTASSSVMPEPSTVTSPAALSVTGMLLLMAFSNPILQFDSLMPGVLEW